MVAALFATIEREVGRFEPRTSIAKAMGYLLNQRGPLTLFLTDARVPIHNNLSERALRIAFLREFARVARLGVIIDYRNGHTLRIWGRHLRHRLGLMPLAPANPSPNR